MLLNLTKLAHVQYLPKLKKKCLCILYTYILMFQMPLRNRKPIACLKSLLTYSVHCTIFNSLSFQLIKPLIDFHIFKWFGNLYVYHVLNYLCIPDNSIQFIISIKWFGTFSNTIFRNNCIVKLLIKWFQILYKFISP